jgi:hypothetical protein
MLKYKAFRPLKSCFRKKKITFTTYFCAMKYFFRINGVFLLALSLLFSSCETDVDVIAPYQEKMVVYGLLNQTDTIQLIKINKVFFGQRRCFGHGKGA